MDLLLSSLIRANERPSGEKLGHPFHEKGWVKVWSRSRVTASRTSVLSGRSTATNLLHDDHPTIPVTSLCFMVAEFCPHEIGTPRITLAKG